MNHFLHFEERLQTGTWLLDLRPYNRDPTLNKTERKALDQFVETRRRYPFIAIKKILPPSLERIYAPFNLALDLIGVQDARKTRTLTLMLEYLNGRQTHYWGWIETDWLHFFNRGPITVGPSLQSACGIPLVATAYLLSGFCAFQAVSFQPALARIAQGVFGAAAIQTGVNRVHKAILASHTTSPPVGNIRILLNQMFLYGGSSYLEDITPELASYVLTNLATKDYTWTASRLSEALFTLGILEQQLIVKAERKRKPISSKALQTRSGRLKKPETASPEWQAWCQRWRERSPLRPATRKTYYEALLQAGRWLQATHPEIISPEQWTRTLATDFVAAVDGWRAGDWTVNISQATIGKPLSANRKVCILSIVRLFFLDCQAWGWLPQRFDPGRCLATPRTWKGLINPKPESRVIDDSIWARLVWAGLHLDANDLELFHLRLAFPYEMVRAIAVTWLFCGLRANELRRLRVGCVRWPQSEERTVPATVCFLEVPADKSQPTYTKAVDALVGEAITAWEQVRPSSQPVADEYTSEPVDYLFCYQGKTLSKQYLNDNLIPMLCRKASIPQQDSKGRITSHRARATIASQLANADDPMSLLALKEWLGHQKVSATLYYVRDNTATLTKAYTDAGYFGRNVRVIEVLIDRQAINSRATAEGEPWKYYDLGHGYCTYDFFDQCPHRMACAKCTFYRPKATTEIQLQEAQDNLLHMLQMIPLTEDEQAAVNDGLEAVVKLCQRLAETPAPDGRTPNQLQAQGRQIGIIPLSSVRLRLPNADGKDLALGTRTMPQ